MLSKVKNIKEYLLFFIYRSFLAPVIFFMPVFLEEKDITGWKSGILMGSIYATGIIMSFPAGILNDRFQPRSLMISALVLSSLSFVIFALFGTFPAMVGVFILYGIGRNFFQVSFDSMFYKEIIKGEGCIHVGRYMTIVTTSAIAGMFVTIFMVQYFSFKYLYLTVSSVYLIAIFAAAGIKTTAVKTIPVSHYKKDLFKPDIIAFGFLVFLFAMHWGAEDTSYALFLKHYLGLSKTMSSIYMLSEFITLGITSYVISALVDKYKFSLRWIFIIGMIISGAALILKVNKSFEISIAMRMLHGVGDGLVLVVIYYGISKVFELEKVGGNMSVVMITQIAGAFTGAVIFSKVGVVYGYEFSFIITGVILIVTGALFALYNLMKFSLRD